MNESILYNSIERFEFNNVILAELSVLAKGYKKRYLTKKYCTVHVLILCQSEFLT